MVYLLGWVALYYSAFFERISRYRGTLLACVSLGFLGAIALFRGSVGTDTANYEHIANLIWQNTEPLKIEVGFKFLMESLHLLMDSEALAVRSISLIILFFILLFLFRSDRDERFILMFYIAPVFFYIFTMNTLRLGLASCFLLLSIQSYRRHNVMLTVALSMLAFSFHYSILASLLIIWAPIKKWNTNSICIFLLGAIVAIGVYWINKDYFFFKYIRYGLYEKPSAFSGLSIIALNLTILSGVLFSNLPRPQKKMILGFNLTFCMLFLWLSMYSYAGIRLLDLLSFSLPLGITTVFGSNNLRFNSSIKYSLLIAGILGAGNLYRIFLSTAGNGLTPFLPYVMINL